MFQKICDRCGAVIPISLEGQVRLNATSDDTLTSYKNTFCHLCETCLMAWGKAVAAFKEEAKHNVGTKE